VGLRSLERVARDVAMFPGEIADLTSSGFFRIARIYLPPNVRVEMGFGTGAVAIGGNRLVMDMVGYRRTTWSVDLRWSNW
jgi:hypothetical protein